ncbi:hypothetical protein pdam_00016890 [Pocillopora damicornis]|uniref:Uncharacterized protein n=1 Tax=Pocillopora damicornis TaxID=46731 RepID=A0A3M6TMB4_POCDA|nr:hypothetical protein pdam_00016890 [Pocillopora damicornis]
MPVGNDPATTAKAAALGGVSGHTDTIEMQNLKFLTAGHPPLPSTTQIELPMVLGGAGESTNGTFSQSSSTSLSNSVKLFRGDMRQDNGIGGPPLANLTTKRLSPAEQGYHGNPRATGHKFSYDNCHFPDVELSDFDAEVLVEGPISIGAIEEDRPMMAPVPCPQNHVVCKEEKGE